MAQSLIYWMQAITKHFTLFIGKIISNKSGNFHNLSSANGVILSLAQVLEHANQ